MNKIKMGKKFACGGYDKWWIKRNVRHIIFNKYNAPVTDDLLDEIFKIIKQGE